MKKRKSVEGIVKNTGLVECLVESVMRVFNIDRKTAYKIVEMRMDSVANSMGKKLQDGKYQINQGDLKSKLSEMSIDDIINNENIIKDK